MKQQRFKQRLAMLIMAGMIVSQAGAPVFAVTYDESIFGYYGKQMIEKIDNVSASTTAAQIYASFYNAWLGDGTEDFYSTSFIEYDQMKMMEKTYLLTEEIGKIIVQALQALMYDHPETYWMVGDNWYYTIYCDTWTDKPSTISLKVEKLNNVKGDTEKLNDIKAAVEAATTTILNTLNADASDYEKVVAINKYLVEQLDYNQAAAATTDAKYDQAHTILGALVGTADVEKGNVVCEGYAKAFKAICDKMGIECIIVAGEGEVSGTKSPHMWNYVKMDEKWYLADITWNDPIGGDPDKISTEYLLIGKEDSHIPNDGVLSSTASKIKVKFDYPTLSTTTYEYIAKSNNAKLKSLKYAVADGDFVEVKDFDATKTNYSVVLPETTNAAASIKVTASPEDDSITVAPVDIQLENGVGKAEIVVTAEDGITTQKYTINFSIAKSSNALLSSLKYKIAGEEVSVSDFNASTAEYNVELPYSTAKDAIIDIIAAAHSESEVKCEPVQLVDGSATATITVTSEDGKVTKTYKINFTTAGDTRSKANDITGFVLAGAEGKIENNMINVEVPYGTVLTGVTPTITYSDKATVAVKGGLVADFNKPVTYVVTAENGTTKEYIVNVKVLSSIVVKQGLNTARVNKGKNATFKIEFMPTIDGDYTIIWNSATQKNKVSHIKLEANKTTSSALTIEKVTSADKGEVSVKISRDADPVADCIESKAELGIKSSSSSASSGNTTPSTNSNNNTSGGGGGGLTTPSADKKVKEAWKDLSTTKQEEIKEKFTNNMPYVLPADGLTEGLVKELLGSDFTDAQVKEVVAEPSKLKDLGIDYTVDIAALTPVEEVSFKDMKDSHWAYGNVEKLAKLGIVKGFEDGTFRPKEALVVADTFTFLNRVMLLNNDIYMNLSRETVEKYVTNKESWAFKDVATISSKLSEKTLKEISPLGNTPLSRELLAQVLFEATQGKLAQSADSINFIDTQNSAYKEAIDYCVRAGLLKGTSANKMEPERALTRAELMTVLVRLNDLMK